ncbi:MAG: hypothetical protein UY62_C0028G0009 [Parcubacteria group bacterium GW2011_GWF2_50_9]|nr:MAG: hypothetical protein UY62_C0028G0009 [Parcubacteria group bacterium GW2011_GWF2_50_9]
MRGAAANAESGVTIYPSKKKSMINPQAKLNHKIFKKDVEQALNKEEGGEKALAELRTLGGKIRSEHE